MTKHKLLIPVLAFATGIITVAGFIKLVNNHHAQKSRLVDVTIIAFREQDDSWSCGGRGVTTVQTPDLQRVRICGVYGKAGETYKVTVATLEDNGAIVP